MFYKWEFMEILRRGYVLRNFFPKYFLYLLRQFEILKEKILIKRWDNFKR